MIKHRNAKRQPATIPGLDHPAGDPRLPGRRHTVGELPIGHHPPGPGLELLDVLEERDGGDDGDAHDVRGVLLQVDVLLPLPVVDLGRGPRRSLETAFGWRRGCVWRYERQASPKRLAVGSFRRKRNGTLCTWMEMFRHSNLCFCWRAMVMPHPYSPSVVGPQSSSSLIIKPNATPFIISPLSYERPSKI